MATVRFACTACSAACEIDMTQCQCGTCVPQEAAFYGCGWMDWKGKMYCCPCLSKYKWKVRAGNKARQHFYNQIDEMCPAVIESAIVKGRKPSVWPEASAAMNPNATGASAASANSTPCTKLEPNSLNAQGDKAEVHALRVTVEALMTRVTALEDVLPLVGGQCLHDVLCRYFGNGVHCRRVRCLCLRVRLACAADGPAYRCAPC